MVLVLKTKKNTKNLLNTFNFYENPTRIADKGIKTQISKKKNRLGILLNSFKHLEAEDLKNIIDHIKDKPEIIEEYLDAFESYPKDVDSTKVSQFFHVLSQSINNPKYKPQCIKLIYLNDSKYYLNLMKSIDDRDKKTELCQIGYEIYPERGYLFSIIGKVNINVKPDLDMNKLLDEINVIQRFGEKSLLDMLLEDFYDVKGIINTINNRVKDLDLDMYYTLSKNLEVVDKYKIDVNTSKLRFVEAINEYNNIQLEEYIKKHLNDYKTEWVKEVCTKLARGDAKSQKAATLIINSLIKRDHVLDKYSDSIFDIIYPVINKNRALREDLFRILVRLKTKKAFELIIELLSKEGLVILKNTDISRYLEQVVGETTEYEWYDRLKNTNQFIKCEKNLNPNILVYILQDESPKDIYNFIKIISKEEESLYRDITRLFEEIISKKLRRYENIMVILIIMKYTSENKIVDKEIKKYERDNTNKIEAIKRQIDPKLIIEEYQDEVIGLLDNKSYDALSELIQNIKDSEVKRRISAFIVKKLINDNIDGLSLMWDKLDMDVVTQSKYTDVIIAKIKTGRIDLSKNTILLADKLGMDPVSICGLARETEYEIIMLDMWHLSGNMGKITAVIKDRITNNCNDISEIIGIRSILERFDITDHNIKFLMEVKSYSVITIMLLQANVDSGNIIELLDNISNHIINFGLTGRFINDKSLHKEIGKEITDYIVKSLMKDEVSIDVLRYYWEDIVLEYRISKNKIIQDKLYTFLTMIFKSKARIDWLLDCMNQHDLPDGLLLIIIETMMILLNDYHRMNMQILIEKDNIANSTLNCIAHKISSPITILEKSIISNKETTSNDILIENMKRLRIGLKEIGFEPVEDIDNYGKVVAKDNLKHQAMNKDNSENGLVDSLGLIVEDNIVTLSSLLNIE